NPTNCGRNITADNIFTSVSLVTKFLAKKKRSHVGITRGNKKELIKITRTNNGQYESFLNNMRIT
ncbi:unnamed protein product, partial [Heterotrigona itama]